MKGNDYANAVDPQTDNSNMHQEAAQRPPKEYAVKVDVPGRRWKIVHRTPFSADGCVERTYFVAREPFRLTCSCPAGRYRKPCKHARFVANLIGQPALAPT